MLFTVFGLLSASTSCRLRFYTWQVLIFMAVSTNEEHARRSRNLFVNFSELSHFRPPAFQWPKSVPDSQIVRNGRFDQGFWQAPYNSHATPSALRLGLPKHVVKAWSAAWKGQRRILHMRHSCSSLWADGIGNLPQGDLAPLDSCVVSSRALIVLNNGSLISLSLPNVPGRQILVLQQAVNLFTHC